MDARGHARLRKLARDMRADGVVAYRSGSRFEAQGLFRRSRELDEVLDEVFGTGPCERCGLGDIPSRVCDDCLADLQSAGFGADDRRFLATLDGSEVARGFLRAHGGEGAELTGDDVADAKSVFFAQFLRGKAVGL